jgi:acyl-coenzyme A thioesterase PaaI-like protein
LTGISFSLVAGVYSLWRLQQREKTIDRKEGEGVVELKKIEKYVFHLGYLQGHVLMSI